MPFVDCTITNCGAGSVTVPLAYGKPQACHWVADIAGADKFSNEETLSQDLHVGPSMKNEMTRGQIPFATLMQKMDANFTTYQDAAKRAQKLIQSESAAALENLVAFFWKMSTDAAFQNQVASSGKIPSTFALARVVTPVEESTSEESE